LRADLAAERDKIIGSGILVGTDKPDPLLDGRRRSQESHVAHDNVGDQVRVTVAE
jgi:hypothetical protein